MTPDKELDAYYAGMTPEHRKREAQYLAFNLTQVRPPEELEELAMHLAAIERASK